MNNPLSDKLQSPNAIDLDFPELGVQRENERIDSLLRSFNSMVNYARLNGFEDRLDTILNRMNGKKWLKIADNPQASIATLRTLKTHMPQLKNILRTVGRELKDKFKAGRKGVQALTTAITYNTKDKEGRTVQFTLDPEKPASRTLREFEKILNNHAYGTQIASQFIPTFQEIKRELVARWKWDEKNARVPATLYAIRQLCTEWFH